MSKTNPFVNRIVGYGTKPADQFEANPYNYRTHPQRQRDAVQASLRELGWIGVVVENTVTGRLIDGHERVWQALANNEEVPFIQVALSEDEEKLALAVFDPLGAMAETDSEILDALLREVNTGESALQELLAELAEDELPPALDELSAKYGEPGERDFWPRISVVVSPEAHELYQSLCAVLPGDDESEKMALILEAVDATLLSGN